MAIRARGDSVRLMPSTSPLSASALAKMSDRSMPLGGVSSVVTANVFARIFSESLLMKSVLRNVPLKIALYFNR
jgi:hypothetical protein